VKRSLIVFAVLFLIASTANLVAAILLFIPSTRPFPVPWPAASAKPPAAHPWPGPTPHPQPWPAVSYWADLRATGRERIDARASRSSDQVFSMQVDRSGWPLPVLQHTERWWPWDHPTWKLPTNTQDAGFSLLLPGLVLNPLAGAAGAWLLIFGPVLIWRAVQARRRKAHECRRCGYDLRGLGAGSACPECGTVRGPAPAIAAPV
jgi:hypothetical protein